MLVSISRTLGICTGNALQDLFLLTIDSSRRRSGGNRGSNLLSRRVKLVVLGTIDKVHNRFKVDNCYCYAFHRVLAV